MSESERLADMMNRVRAGDQDAAAELVKQYEPMIRRMVRLRLRDERLSRDFESMDVCQSVLASFFVRAAVGTFGARTIRLAWTALGRWSGRTALRLLCDRKTRGKGERECDDGCVGFHGLVLFSQCVLLAVGLPRAGLRR